MNLGLIATKFEKLIVPCVLHLRRYIFFLSNEIFLHKNVHYATVFFAINLQTIWLLNKIVTLCNLIRNISSYSYKVILT